MQSESAYGKAPPEAGLFKQGEPIRKKILIFAYNIPSQIHNVKYIISLLFINICYWSTKGPYFRGRHAPPVGQFLYLHS
jgi:hypothetical protein